MSKLNFNNKLLIYSTLVIFILTKAIQPIGFMPSPVAEGAPFVLCHGDPQSAQIIQSLHLAHNHDGQQQSSKSKCDFSVSGFIDILDVSAIYLTQMFIDVCEKIVKLNFFISKYRYLIPELRAPPTFLKTY